MLHLAQILYLGQLLLLAVDMERIAVLEELVDQVVGEVLTPVTVGQERPIKVLLAAMARQIPLLTLLAAVVAVLVQ
jgi:hypothetical protein